MGMGKCTRIVDTLVVRSSADMGSLPRTSILWLLNRVQYPTMHLQEEPTSLHLELQEMSGKMQKQQARNDLIYKFTKKKRFILQKHFAFRVPQASDDKGGSEDDQD